MDKFKDISDRAQNLIAQLKDTAGNAVDSVKKHPEALTGIAGAGAGALISHLMQDPNNRSMANYLMGAGAGAGLGALAGNVMKKSTSPDTMIYKSDANIGNPAGRALGWAGKRLLVDTPKAGAKLVGSVLQLPGRIVQGMGNSQVDISNGPVTEGPKPLGVLGNTASAATTIALAALLLTSKGRAFGAGHIRNVASKVGSKIRP